MIDQETNNIDVNNYRSKFGPNKVICRSSLCIRSFDFIMYMQYELKKAKFKNLGGILSFPSEYRRFLLTLNMLILAI